MKRTMMIDSLHLLIPVIVLLLVPEASSTTTMQFASCICRLFNSDCNLVPWFQYFFNYRIQSSDRGSGLAWAASSFHKPPESSFMVPRYNRDLGMVHAVGSATLHKLLPVMRKLQDAGEIYRMEWLLG